MITKQVKYAEHNNNNNNNTNNNTFSCRIIAGGARGSVVG
jgi:hypothetical protein